MKNHFALIALFVLMVSSTAFVGCAESSDQAQKLNVAPPDKSSQKNEGEESDAEQNAEDIFSTDDSGGQPGEISFSGIIVTKDSEGELNVDSRLSYSQEGGRGLDGQQVAVMAEVAPKFYQNLTEKQLNNLDFETKTYINFGCELTSEETEGLTADTTTEDHVLLNNVPIAETVSKSATKIFICDQQTTPSANVILTAKELILKNAHWTLESDGLGGQLSITTQHLVLTGENKILAPGKDGPLLENLDGPDVHVSVSEKLDGEGSLSVETVGGNRLSSLSSEEKAQLRNRTGAATNEAAK